MWIEHGHLRNFRNYDDLQLDWVSQKNLFIGQNAAGKTNILEAIYVMSHGKSPRTRHDRELIQWQQPFATVKLETHSHSHGGSLTLELQLTLSSENTLKTLFKINGNPVKNRSEIIGKIPTVTFFLSDLLLLRGTPEDRRNALDSSLVQYDPLHFKRVNAYNRVRQQKGQYLRQLPQMQDNDVLESLNQQLVSAGAELMHARLTYLNQIEALAELRYHELSGGRENLRLEYQTSFKKPVEVPATEALEELLRQGVQEVYREEQRRGLVLVGPHRDDIRFFLNEKDASHFGSQGQQRSIVLAMKLAEIQILEQRLQDECPILLLDDVMAELDPERQKQLLMHLNPDMQVFLTTTHLDPALEWYLHGAQSVRIFSVSQGHVLDVKTGAMEQAHVELPQG